MCLKSQHCLLRECTSRKNNVVSSYISVHWLHSIVDGSHKYECNAQFILVAELIVFIAYLLFSNGVEATHMQPQKTIAKWITFDIHSFTLSVRSIIIHLVNKLPFNEQHLKCTGNANNIQCVSRSPNLKCSNDCLCCYKISYNLSDV